MNKAEMARTESAYREVNEAIAATAAKFEADETDFVCECADPECADRVTVELADYEGIRRKGTRFLLARGHAEAKIERLVEHHDEYDIVEKIDPVAAEVARALNPRAA